MFGRMIRYNGAKVRSVQVRDLRLGNTIWFEQDGKDEQRVVAEIRYNTTRQLVWLQYENYIGEDLWGAHAEVQREVKS